MMLNFLYKLSLESDCHQLPKWGRLKEHALPPCLVLVIDDNPYGLMVCLELHLKGLSIGFAWRSFIGFKAISRRLCVDQGGIQGFIQRLVMWELSLLQACLEEEDCVNLHVYLQDIILVNQVDQHTKRTRCTERDQVIQWYGKHCPLRFVY